MYIREIGDVQLASEAVLLAICVLVPAIYAYCRSKGPSGIEVNHVTLFTFGFLFYWIMPIAIGGASDTLADEEWSYVFSTGRYPTEYMLACLSSFVAFACGDTLGTLFVRQTTCHSPRLSTRVLATLSMPAAAMLIYTAYANYDFLFQAYGVDIDAERARGTVTAYVIFLADIALLYLCDHDTHSLGQLVRSSFIWPFLAACAFMLCAGSRLYVVSFVLMAMVYRSCFIRRIMAKGLICGVLLIASTAGLIGVFRVGENFRDIGRNLILEPIFTSLSLAHYLRYERIVWLALPKYLVSDLKNLIPTAVLPQKADFILAPDVYNPLGALHSFVSFNLNFGVVGTWCFMFALPIFLRWLRARSMRQLARVCYVMLSGWLAFTFFRDSFSISLVKTMLEFSLLVPVVIVGAIRLSQWASMVQRQSLPSSSQIASED